MSHGADSNAQETMADRRPLPLPGLIGLLFGSLWGVLGSQSLPLAWRLPAAGLCGVIGLVLAVRLLRRPSLGGSVGLLQHPAYAAAVAGAIVGIYSVTSLLPQLGLDDYLVPAVALIVGLHFLGLWRAAGAPHFLWIAAAMCTVSVSAMVLPHADWRILAAGVGNALVLWVGLG